MENRVDIHLRVQHIPVAPRDPRATKDWRVFPSREARAKCEMLKREGRKRTKTQRRHSMNYEPTEQKLWKP